MLDSIMQILPSSLRYLLSQLTREVHAELEEIRIREARPLEIGFNGKYAFLNAAGQLVQHEQEAYKPSHEECTALLELLTNHSLYTFEEELKRGFITITGGHRVGLAGRTILEQGQVKQIRDVSSFNLRVAREVQGVARPVLPFLIDPEGCSIHHTLIISPPQQGKTTLIRDLARLISSGDWGTGIEMASRRGVKVGIVDERSELAACVKGVPRFDLGPRTDVMDGCPKAEGMMMMIRALSPEVLIVDEIGRQEDALAIREALHAGIRVIATAHGTNLDDVQRRPVLKELAEEHVFTRYVVLGRRRGDRASFRVLDSHGRPLQNHSAYRVERS
jgi:stage III sporulation protein AA